MIAVERGLHGRQLTRRAQERIDAFRQFGVAHDRKCSASLRRPSNCPGGFSIFLILEFVLTKRGTPSIWLLKIGAEA